MGRKGSGRRDEEESRRGRRVGVGAETARERVARGGGRRWGGDEARVARGGGGRDGEGEGEGEGDDDNSVENALVTMYAKCGNVQIALKIFNSMRNRGIISWNALITSFSQHGNEVAAIQLFDLMQEEAVCPDDYTFVGLLSSCSRMGLAAEGCEYFKQMKAKYNVEPKMEHYTCMVDLFARAGRFCDAMEFIEAMPCQPDQLMWEALLSSCRVHGNVELGRLAAKKILEIRPEDPSPYIILSSIHASVDMWDEKARNRTVFDFHRVRKETGSSWVDAKEFSDDIFDALQVGVT